MFRMCFFGIVACVVAVLLVCSVPAPAQAKTAVITAKEAAQLDKAPKKGTLDYALQKRCQKILKKITSKKKSKAKQLRDAYNYLGDHKKFKYYMYNVNTSNKTWVKRYAYQMLGNHKGDCRGFAAAFAALAYEIGYDVEIVMTRIRSNPHAFNRINGRFYDTEKANVYGYKNYYRVKKYPERCKINWIKRYSKFDGSCAPQGTSGKVRAAKIMKPIVVKKGSSYRGYENTKGGKKLKGLWCIKGKVYKFDSKGKMSVKAYKTLKKALREGKPWSELRKLTGSPKTKYKTSSCYGQGVDWHYRYKQIEVQTFAPADGTQETVVGAASL